MEGGWTEDNEKMLKNLIIHFGDCSEFHDASDHSWTRIFTICTILSIILSFSALCLEVLMGKGPFMDYYNFFEKVFGTITISYLFAINPSEKSASHSRSSLGYIKLISRISTQLNISRSTRRHFSDFLYEIRTKYNHIVEENRPPKKLIFPAAIWHTEPIHCLEEDVKSMDRSNDLC